MSADPARARIRRAVAGLAPSADRRAGAGRGLLVGGLASVVAIAMIASNHGFLAFDQPWNLFEVPIGLTVWLGAPAGLVGGWLFGPRSRSRARPIGRIIAEAAIAAPFVGIVLLAFVEIPIGVIWYGPVGSVVGPAVLVFGTITSPTELPFTAPAAALWVAWMRLTAPSAGT